MWQQPHLRRAQQGEQQPLRQRHLLPLLLQQRPPNAPAWLMDMQGQQLLLVRLWQRLQPELQNMQGRVPSTKGMGGGASVMTTMLCSAMCPA